MVEIDNIKFRLNSTYNGNGQYIIYNNIDCDGDIVLSGSTTIVNGTSLVTINQALILNDNISIKFTDIKGCEICENYNVISAVCTPFTGSAIIIESILFSFNFSNKVTKNDTEFQLESKLLITDPTNIVIINNTTSTFSSGSGTATPDTYTIQISAIGENGVVTSGTLIILSISGGPNPITETSTTGLLNTSYIFLANETYTIDAEIQYDQIN